MTDDQVTEDRYELVDFGEGRKLESLAGYLIERPSPAAAAAKRGVPAIWSDADATFDNRTKQWSFARPWPASLDVDCGRFRMPVQPTPFGHIGIFPEQATNWNWLVEQGGEILHRCTRKKDSSDWALNLFGYTGAATMALVSTGWKVTHVDAAKPNVLACRRNAEHNGYGEAEIRYLVDDAAKLVAREIRRGRRYRMLVLDPPAYGHAPGGKAWRLERDLWPLLNQCLELVQAPFGMLITGHSPQVDQRAIVSFLRQHEKLQSDWQSAGLNLSSGRSQLADRRGRPLDFGFFVRLWSRTAVA